MHRDAHALVVCLLEELLIKVEDLLLLLSLLYDGFLYSLSELIKWIFALQSLTQRPFKHVKHLTLCL